MKRKIQLLFLLVLGGTLTSYAQLSGGEAYLQGDFVEVGIGSCGCYGTTAKAPTGYHANMGGGNLGFVADHDKDGWTTGTPDRCGDYFLPGSPEEGFGVRFNGNNYGNYAKCGTVNISGGTFTSCTSPGAADQSATWTGSKSGMDITATTFFPKGALYFVTQVTLTNTTTTTMTDVYYMRSLDPDNDQISGGGFTTDQEIVSQADSAAGECETLVTATGTGAGCFLGLGARDFRARCTYGGFSNRNPKDIYDASGSFTGTVGSTHTGDEAISISFKLGDLAPGESVSCAFAYVLSTDDLEEALAQTALFSLAVDKVAVPSIGTDSTIVKDLCDLSPIDIIIGGGDKYDWTWTPSTGLSTDKGPSVIVTPSTDITYTAVGISICDTVKINLAIKVKTDTLPPTIEFCPPDTVITTDTCGFFYGYELPRGYDPCGPVTATKLIGLDSGELFPFGITNVSYELEDVSGKKDTCSFIVEVIYDGKPTINCPADAVISTEAGKCGAIHTYLPPIATDCPSVPVTVTQIAGLGSGAEFPIGITEEKYVATTAFGSDTCSFTVEVIDDIPPVVVCPGDISVDNDLDSCGAVVTYVYTTSDNCGVADTTLLAGLESGSTFPIGTTTVTYEVTDVNGLKDTCSFDVTVVDSQMPVITCIPDVYSCDLVVNYDQASIEASASDNCAFTIVTPTDLTSGSTFTYGTTLVEYKVIDASGNETTCSFNVTVIEPVDAGTDGTYSVCPDGAVDDLFSSIGGTPMTTGGYWVAPDGTIFSSTITANFNPFTDLVGDYLYIVPGNSAGGVTCPSDTAVVTVSLYDFPTVSTIGDTSMFVGKPLVLETVSDGVEFEWSPSTYIDDENAQNPTTYPGAEITYIVKAVSADGCVQYDTVTISVFDGAAVTVPTAFTPNGDDLNDVFIVKGLYFDNFEVQIFNRWGEVIHSYRQRDNDGEPWQGWDGTFRGNELPNGSYPFTISYTLDDELDAKIHVIKGKITIVK